MGGNQVRTTKHGRNLSGADQQTSRRFPSQMKKSTKSGRNGQDLIEFALILPILFLVIFGVLDLGRLFHATITITNAAREGARFATINPDALDGEIIQKVRNEAASTNIDLSSTPISVIPTRTGDLFNSSTPVQVVVSYNFSLLIGSVLQFPDIPLTYSAVMEIPRRE